MYYSTNLKSHDGSVCLQLCVLNQPLEVEMLVQYVLILVLKSPNGLNVGGEKKMEPGSRQWCPVTGQDATSTNRTTGNVF